MNYKYVSIDRIFSKLVRDLGGGSIIEGDVIEWCGEALEFIGSSRYYEEAVAFIEVQNHQCALPIGTHNVIQIARNNCWSAGVADILCPASVASESVTSDSDTPSVPVILDCNGQPLTDYDLAYYRPYFDLKWEHSFWCGTGMYRHCYSPVRLKTHSFFNSLVCEEPDNSSVYSTNNDEYTIVQGKVLRFSFKEGSIALAYTRQILDIETGYPMIPDNISYTTAIVKYVTMKIFEKQFYAGREGAKGKLDKAESDWHWYCKQAGNIDIMPYGEDEHQNLLDQRSYILPRQGRYFGFFGNLAQPENRVWNRNRRGTNFIG